MNKLPTAKTTIPCDDMVNWHVANTKTIVTLSLPVQGMMPFDVVSFNAPEYLASKIAKKVFKDNDKLFVVMIYNINGFNFNCTVVYRDKMISSSYPQLANFYGWKNVPTFNTGKFTTKLNSNVLTFN